MIEALSKTRPASKEFEYAARARTHNAAIRQACGSHVRPGAGPDFARPLWFWVFLGGTSHHYTRNETPNRMNRLGKIGRTFAFPAGPIV